MICSSETIKVIPILAMIIAGLQDKTGAGSFFFNFFSFSGGVYSLPQILKKFYSLIYFLCTD
jgi:hypothetical protein